MADTLDEKFDALRREMLEVIAAYVGLSEPAIGKAALSPRVMEAMGRVPRHRFVPAELRHYAYVDSPLPIGYEKTIAQPFMVALMADLLDPGPGDTVLEIGTGLGYHAAVLAELAGRIYSVEIIEELARRAMANVEELSLANVEVRHGDGNRGWPERAPFDRILVAAAPELIPPTLIGQLKPGGRMVIPAGLEDSQVLMVVERDVDDGRVQTRSVMPVRFARLVTSH